jgi:hypothetical protein
MVEIESSKGVSRVLLAYIGCLVGGKSHVDQCDEDNKDQV